MKHNTIVILTAAAAALALCGCQRDSLISADSAIRYEVSVADIATKGELVNNNDNNDYSDIALVSALSPFYVAAYNGTSPVFTTSSLDPANVETVNYVSGSWTMRNTYFWPQSTVLTFFAYGNLPEDENTSVEITSAGQTLTHAMLSDVADQKDILLGYYQGRGENGNTAKIRFLHPLTSVFFKVGDMGDETITSISLSGLAASGTVAMDANGIIGGWQDVADYTVTSSQSSNDSGLSVNSTTNVIGDPFILIPQNLATNGVKLTVKCKSGLTFETAIGSGEWKSQKTNWYTLNYGSTTNWTLEVTPWDDGVNGDIQLSEPEYVFEVNEDSHTFNVTTAQEIATINVTSAICAGDEPAENVGWTIKSVKVGSNPAQTINASSFSSIGGLSAETTVDGNLKLTANERINPNNGGHAYWTGDNGDWSPEDWTSSTASNPIDLSKFDPYSDAPRTNGKMTTANCYIIRHAGTYKIPLVYGNGVVDGDENTQSYYPNETGGTNRLDSFLNHKGNGITSAFIENNTGCTAADDGCCIVWQDEAFVIKDLKIVGSKAGNYTKGNVRYLQFTVDNSTICQNNAVIAVKDTDGNIMWSWLIWTTNDPALLGDPYEVSSTDGNYYFFRMNSVGWMDETEYPAMDEVVITLEQTGTGNAIDITVDQPEVSEQARSNYYEFGRKDPMCRKDSPVSGEFIKGAGKVNLQTAIMNPDTYYHFGGDPQPNNDWCSTTYDNLWTGKLSVRSQYTIASSSALTKTVYDPSPVGYQVPSYHALSAALKQGTPVFADQGYRVRKSGNFSGFGYRFYFAASPLSDSDAYMILYQPTIQNSCRAHATPIRPILEQNPGE